MAGIPPHNPDAEEALLGAALLSRRGVEALADLVTPSDFYREKDALICRAILTLDEQGMPVDAIAVSEVLAQDGLLDKAGGRGYVHGLVSDASAFPRRDGEIVRDYAAMRRLQLAGLAIAQVAAGAGTPSDRQAESERLLADALDGRVRQLAVPLDDGLDELLSHIDGATNVAAMRTIPTGFRKLDDILAGGLRGGQLVMIAARPSVGKTALGWNIAENVALAGGRTLVFSLEMKRRELQARSLARFSGVDLRTITKGALDARAAERVHDAATTVRAMGRNLSVADKAPENLTELRLMARSAHHQASLDLIVVDYLQLAQPDRRSDSRNSEVSEISRGLKMLAQAYDVPVVALSQLSRATEKRDDKRPVLSDLRDSGSLEQDADAVLFLYRRDYYDKDDCPMAERGVAEAIVAKNRQGPLGTAHLGFVPHLSKFTDVSTDRQETYV